MAFWNTTKIKTQCQAQGLITPYREDRVLRCAYELGVGPEAYITSKTEDNTHLGDGVKVTIPPGQFGLLVTKEVVFVPNNAIGFISIRAGIKFQGLVNVSGFHVDPGFRGPLKFAVYNAGSRDITLDQDERVFMLWFADLNEDTPDPYGTAPATTSIITSKDVDKLKGEVASPAELKKQIDEMEKDIGVKFNATEQSRLYNRNLLFLLIGIIATALLKPYFDSNKDSAKPAAVVQQADNQGPAARIADGEKIVAVPGHLGLYILGASGITAASIIAAALMVRNRSK